MVRTNLALKNFYHYSFYGIRCRCKEKISSTKPQKSITDLPKNRQGRPLKYPMDRYVIDEERNIFENALFKTRSRYEIDFISNSRSKVKKEKYYSKIKVKQKTYQIKYEKNLSTVAKFTLNSFQNKYFYYAIDDILYFFKSNPIERDNLLAILYSPVLSLQNNFSINFFDIWISNVNINEITKANKFLNNGFLNREKFNYITITLFYKVTERAKKQEPLW